MILKYFDINEVAHLVEEYFYLTFSEDDLPFKSRILPIGLTHLFYIDTGQQHVVVDKTKTTLSGLMITGQYFRSYQFSTNTITSSIGVSLHPTALYKLLNTDISKLENKHVPLVNINPKFYDKIRPIFEKSSHPKELTEKLTTFFLNQDLTINKNTDCIDKVIDIIKNQDGLLNINDILEHINISQKTLETQFKKIVGITPGKYIRLFRFLTLMRKYENQEIAIKDLMYMFDYYDRSHFSKDFKLFMNETPKSYFKKDYPLLKAVFKHS